MIKISITENEIIIKGHANYDLFGKDIVCASVSSIVITSINAIEKFNKDYIKHSYNKDTLKIEIINNNEITSNLIDNMINLLKELESYYPKNIKII